MKLIGCLGFIAFGTVGAACGGSLVSAPAPEEAASVPEVAPPPPRGSCLAGERASAPQLSRLELAGDALSFCRTEDDGDFCYALDLASGALSAAGAPDAEREHDPFAGLKRSEDGGRVEACGADGRCRRLAVPSGFTAYAGAVSASGAVAALSLEGSGRNAGNWVQLYTLPAGRAGKRFKVEDEHYACMRAGFVGDTLLIQRDVCAGPAGRAHLADAKAGRAIADVGGPDFGAWSLHEQHLGGDLWAFREERGVEVVVQDVRTGAVVHRIDLSATLARTADGGLDTDPSSGAMFRSANGELVVVHDGPAQGTVVLVDPDAGSITRVVRAPWCGE